MKFKYWNNKDANSIVICEIEANDIIEADKKFEERTKLNPVQNPWIGCEIVKLLNNEIT
ncbi:MAG: hypothetical protein AABY22_25580 [Nanoarchaeota archaeon]